MRCLLCALLFLGVGLCQQSCRKQSTAGKEVQIYFTADVNGRLEPCGCFTGQYGGLTRVATWLDYNDPNGRSLRLDVGDALKGTQDYDLLHYQQLARAFAELDYRALNIGAREAALSCDDLEVLRKKTRAPFVSANLVSTESDGCVFPEYSVIDWDGQKIAIIGLLDPASVTNRLGDGLDVRDMDTTLTNLLPRIESEHSPNLVILLAFAEEYKLRLLANRFYELDVILGGDVPQPSQELIRENESLILFTTNQARAVGDLKIKVANDQVTNPTFDVHLMVDTIAQSTKILELSNAYRQLIRKTALEIDDPANFQDDSIIPGSDPGHTYLGSKSCAGCHPSAYRSWLQSGHSHAFASLQRGETDADPNCISCHTVGFGELSGYRREYGPDKLINVGCESCHGPGSEHVKQRGFRSPDRITFHFRPLGASDCTKCHHGEFSRPFDWDEFWPQIKHGKETH